MEPFDRPPRPYPTADPGDYADYDEYDDVGMPPRHRQRARGSEGPSGERSRKRKRSILWRMRRVLFLMALLGMAGVAAGVATIAQAELPPISDLWQSSYVCTAEVAENCSSNNALATISEEGNRDNVKLEDVPQVVQDAIVAAEDRDFWKHQGVDPVGIARALYRDVRAGGLAQGGSTITQQFVKNRFLTHEQTLTRKMKEALLAIKVEQEMSKEEILEGYVNSIYWGRNAYGLGAASQAYFGKPVGELGLPEAAYLAGQIRAPELGDFTNNPEEAARRRRTVLDAMLDEGKISQEQHGIVDAIAFTPENGYREREQYRQIRMRQDVWGGEYVVAEAREQATQILLDRGLSDDDINRGGFRIYTTVDPELQRLAWDAVYNQVLTDPAGPSGALVAVDSEGRVKAMVGGRNFQENNVNLAVQGRQVGSTFKPIALARALYDGFSITGSEVPAPATTTIQPPESTQCDPWEVSNYDEEAGGETGYLNLIEATRESSNTAYARLMTELTPARVEEMARRLGMDSDLGECLPVVLGADNSTALEMAEVYSSFANQGLHREPQLITRIERIDQDGDLSTVYTWEPNPDPERALPEDKANLVTHALRQVVEGGTGHAANIGIPAAGKTGTTQSCKDAWFVGYVPRLTVSVWMGYKDATEPIIDDATGQPKLDENGDPLLQLKPMRDIYGRSCVTGGSLPADIWKRFMTSAVQHMGLQNDTFTEPTPDQLRQGDELLEGAPDTTTSTSAPPVEITPPTPPGSEPDFTRPTGPTTTDPDDTTSTTGGPPSSDTTGPTITFPGGDG